MHDVKSQAGRRKVHLIPHVCEAKPRGMPPCTQHTREGKAYCADHVHLERLGALEERNTRAVRVARRF